MTVDLDLPARPDSIRRAREAVRGLDADLPPEAFDDLRLLVSEVVTNAVRHAGSGPDGRIRFRVKTSRRHVRVHVCDRGKGFAAPRTPAKPGEAGGWGLQLVERLADRWGVEQRGGTCVWFELSAR